MASFRIIDRAETLSALATGLAFAPELALDTEFMRESTYYPRLCLLQLATDEEIVCIDPLVVADLGPVSTLLSRAGTLTIVHAARQDIEVLLTRIESFPAALFDTQVAAALLGLPPQIGYGDLVQRMLDVKLDKAHSRTDWAARPLSGEQLEYAAEDVKFLLPLKRELQAELERLERVAWFEHEMRRIAAAGLYRTEPAEAWQRLKGLDGLDERRLEVARALAGWRERRAMNRDRPRGWILADDALHDLIRALPRTLAALEAVRSVPRGVVERCGEELLRVIAESAHLGEEPFAARRRPRQDPQRDARLKALSAVVRRVAEELGLSPEVLATRRDLQQILNGRRDVEPLRGWRADVVGSALLAAL
jgi:ribonuclease D